VITSSTIGLVVVGYGYWGPNIVRNVAERPELRLVGLCERDELRATEFRSRYAGKRVYPDFDEVLLDPRVEAVAIATPPATHYTLARRALEAGKHVLVEKPLATTPSQALELVELAEQAGLVLMPGHTFLYSPSVGKVRQLIRNNVVGEVYFVTSSRMNLGIYQADGVVLDLAPHDVSILTYWLDEPVVQVAATGRGVFQAGVPETAFLTFEFASGTQANVQVSWLAPRKLRQMVVVGSRRMVQYDDAAGDDSVRIYDRGLDFHQPPENFGEYRLTYRTGDMVAPRIEPLEPLALELQDFARAISEGTEPRSNARFGLEVVRVLHALEQSMRAGGTPVRLAPTEPVLAMHGNGNGNGNGHGHARIASEPGRNGKADGLAR
jgi:predicted dehydrogenase